MERMVSSIGQVPALNVAAYASGNLVGGLITFPGAAQRGFVAIYSVTLVDANTQNAPLDLILFDSVPVSALTDKTAVSIGTADAQKIIGVVPIVASDYSSLGVCSVAGKAGKLGLFMGATSSDNNLYGILVARGAVTYTLTSALTVRLFGELGIQ